MSQELNDFVVTHNYEVKNDPTHGMVLVKDGMPTRCHFQQPMPIAGQLEGSFDLMFFPCSTRCTKAQLIYKGDEVYYGQDCGQYKNAFKVSVAKPEEAKTKFSIIK